MALSTLKFVGLGTPQLQWKVVVVELHIYSCALLMTSVQPQHELSVLDHQMLAINVLIACSLIPLRLHSFKLLHLAPAQAGAAINIFIRSLSQCQFIIKV